MNLEPTLTCGIVSYNEENDIADTIASVLAQDGKGKVSRLIVWDNGSMDKTCEIVGEMAKAEPRLELVAQHDNMGFGRAHNRVLAMVDTDYHVFCNPDIIIEAGALDEMVRMFEAKPEVGLAGPRIINMDGSLQPLNKRNPTVTNLFLRWIASGSEYGPIKKRLEHYEMQDVGYDHPCRVEYLSGAFMVGRMEALKQVGGFDEVFFLYLEDADITRQMLTSGWDAIYWPKAVVKHHWRRDGHKSAKGAARVAVSAFRYFRKWGCEW